LQIRFTGFSRFFMRKRYPSDMTDAQWARVAPIFEGAGRGRPRTVDAREVLNAIFYVLKTGCAWRALPGDLPKWQTVFVQRSRWTRNGVLLRATELLRDDARPSVGIIDSTFIESAYGGTGCAPNGYKRATGNSIHVLIDKQSRPLAVEVLPANLQDAAGARKLLPAAKLRFPSLRLVLGDKAYRQRPLQVERQALGLLLDADSPPLPKGVIFRPLPMRWRIEQFFAWLCKWRRIAKNWCFTVAGFSIDVQWALFAMSLRRADALML
jgi:transposase